MTTESTYAFVVVGLEREDEPVSNITDILEPLGIPIEMVGRGRQLRLQGFVDVLAYQTTDGPTTAE